MKPFVAVLLLLLITFPMWAQITRAPLSSHYTGIGTYSKKCQDVFSGSNNQAALANIHVASAGVYGERRFMLKELSNYAAAIALPTHLGGFGVSMRYFGGTNFSTSQAGLGYGKKLSDKVDIGIQFNYNLVKLTGYGSDGAFNIELGTLWHATEKLHIGIHAYNPTGAKFGKEKTEKWNAIYTVGLGYEAADNFFISTEMAKQEDQPLNANVGMQYSVAEQFFARAGIATGTSTYFIGLGVKWKLYRVDITTTYHPQLGFTPGIMMLFDFKENKQQSEK